MIRAVPYGLAGVNFMLFIVKIYDELAAMLT